MSRSLLTAILSIASAKVGTMLISALFTPLLVRALGPGIYGRYAVILSIFAIANVVMTSGTNDTVRKFTAERDEITWKNAVFGTLARPAAVLAALTAAGFVIGASSGIVERLLGPEYISLFYLLSLYAIGRQCREYLLRTLMGLQLEIYSEPLRVLQKGLFAFFALAAAYLGYNVEGILIADILTSIIITTIAAIALSQVLNLRALISTPAISLPTTRMHQYIGSTILFFGLLTSLYHIDVIFLQFWVPEETVGHYKGALVLTEMLWFAPVAIQLALLQRVSGLWDDGDIDMIQRQASLVTRYALLFTLLVSMGIAALAHDFVPLYFGEGFKPAVTPLLLLLPGVIGFAAARPTLAINQGRRSLRPLILSTGASATINIILNAILIPQYEMIGASIATSIGYGSLVFFQSIAARHIGYAPYRDLPIFRITATTILAAGPIFGLSWLIDSSLIGLLLVPPIGFVAFCSAAIITGSIRMREIRFLLNKPERG